MEAQLDLGHPMSLDHIVALLWDSCYRYVAVFRQNDIDKQDQREDPWCINDDAISRTEAFLSEIQTRVGHLLEKTGDEPWLVRTKAKYELVVNNDRAKAIECLTYLIDTEEVAVSDFITLGNLLYEVWDLEQAVHIFETGFHRTGSTVLFWHVVRYMIEAQGEGEARAFYERSSWELPFSFLRGTIISLDELPDVERLIAVFFSSGISHEWQSEYIRNTSDYISSQIIFHEELEERTLSSRPKKWEKWKELNIQSEIPISLLELYEFQIYYLLEYANLEKYLSIISEHLQSEKGKAFLTSYFEDHSLEQLGTFFDVDALDEVEDMSPPLSEQEHIDGTTTSLETLPDGRAVYIPVVDQRDPSWDDRGDSISYTIGSLDSVGMRNHINRRYAYLQMRLASYDPYGEILQVRRSDLDSSLEGTEAWMEVVSGTDTIDPLNSMRKELMIITDTLRETHPESDMFLESVILAQKVRTEEKRLLHAWPEAKQSYRELIEILDAKYSVTERRYLQWQARDGSYIWADLPPCCKGSPDLVMFFICERILAGCMESFEEKLSEIIHAEPILQLHPIQILTFLEILISQGCYDEAFCIIIRYESSL